MNANSTPRPVTGLCCVCDPQGCLVHTTVATDPQSAIEEWLRIESAVTLVANAARVIRGESKKCLESWEGFEAQGYRIVPVDLIPTHAH
jgi:hypothetical protein